MILDNVFFHRSSPTPRPALEPPGLNAGSAAEAADECTRPGRVPARGCYIPAANGGSKVFIPRLLSGTRKAVVDSAAPQPHT